MGTKFVIEKSEVNKNIQALQNYMKEESIESFYISSFDPFLNEYVPMIDCHRYYITGFSGSVAETLVPANGKVKLYVDGRYHEQADIECEGLNVEVVKVPQSQSTSKILTQDLEAMNPKNIAIEGERTPLAYFEKFQNITEVKTLDSSVLPGFISFEQQPELAPIKEISDDLAGKTVAEKLKQAIKNESQAYFVTAIDTLAWMTNCRGYHLPNLSSFLGFGLVTHNKVYAFIDSKIEVQSSNPLVEFVKVENNLGEKIKSVITDYSLETVHYDPMMLNAQTYLVLKDIFTTDKLVEDKLGLIEYQAVKNEGELNAIRESFKKADKAIYNTLCWVKNQVKAGKEVSERDLYNKTSEMYKEQGAIDQSFGTIAGCDANGSIIHYSDPKSDVLIKDTSMVLLDSGGYFESGFATDTTRTFMGADKEGSAEQKKIYTLVLKGTLNLQNAVFKPRTGGAGLDAVCRQPLYQAGYDYAHGTGHGVGIHVHESGAGISPARNFEMKPGQVVSIEPGIYIPGFGGVRLENIGIVKEHPLNEGFLCFESLVYIGFEPKLIDESLLNAQEKIWLEEYEAECVKRGTSFLF